MTEKTSSIDRQSEFYSTRYSDDERRKVRDLVFAQVYENYFGQSSWMSTADYDRLTDRLELTSERHLLDIACGSGEPSHAGYLWSDQRKRLICGTKGHESHRFFSLIRPFLAAKSRL